MAIEAAAGSAPAVRPGLPGVIIAATIGNVLEQDIELLAHKLGGKERYSGDCAAWPTEAGGKAVSHRIF